jgi:hypothetical protein
MRAKPVGLRTGSGMIAMTGNAPTPWCQQRGARLAVSVNDRGEKIVQLACDRICVVERLGDVHIRIQWWWVGMENQPLTLMVEQREQQG